MDELGLQGIRGQQNSISPTAGISAKRIASIVAERNPFTDYVVMKVELLNATLLRLDIFDELGRSVYAEGLGYKSSGEYRFTVMGSNWQSGTYYARLSTIGGEVRTIKILKQ